MDVFDARTKSRLEAIQKHLRGARRRLLYVLVAFGVGASLTWHFRTKVVLALLAPAGGKLSSVGPPIFTGPTEMLSLVIRLSVLGGLVVAFPVLVYNVFRLLDPLLSKRQKRFVVLFLLVTSVCYLTGTAFAYFVLLPTGLLFLLQFGTDVATPMIRITDYVDLTLAMLFWLGVVFELPLAMLILARLRVVSYQRLKQFRRYVPATAFILGAMITPTFDVVNQTLVAVPLIFLFEVGLFLSWLVRPRVRKPRVAGGRGD